MPTLNISLTPELAELVNSKVNSGLYHSASEVIREGLRLLNEQDEIRRIRLDEIRKEIAIGTAQLEHGEATAYTSGKEVAEKVKADARKRMSVRNSVGT